MLNARKSFGLRPAPKAAPVQVTPRAIAESTVREWVGHKAPLTAAQLDTVARLAR